MKFPGSVLVSLLLFVAETGTALYLSSTYRSAGDRIWQALTLLFALLPCVLVQFNLVFIHRDLSRDRPLVLLLHILQLGPIVRWVAVALMLYNMHYFLFFQSLRNGHVAALKANIGKGCGIC
uniref:XK-related protein n=1 Tax=Terrapene triunguis TaxID=2587831 RepID=A0A674IE27_9SAUR